MELEPEPKLGTIVEPESESKLNNFGSPTLVRWSGAVPGRLVIRIRDIFVFHIQIPQIDSNSVFLLIECMVLDSLFKSAALACAAATIT